MHASSFENMQRCYDRFVRNGPLTMRDEVAVVDVGGANVNGSYRELFADSRYRYVTVDLQAGEGVDIVLDEPARLPFETGSVDIVLCGQMLEHCEFFWQAFAEMVRILKPDGYLFLIAPSAGPIHRYPVDCYRFYPDAYAALAKFADCYVVEVWQDERGPWRDLVGVFCRQKPTARAGATIDPPLTANSPSTRTLWPEGSPEEEAKRGEMPYLDMLATIHATLEPSLYLEIGVRFGLSLRLARGEAIGIDPAPAIDWELPETTRVLSKTSDDYFAEMSSHPLPRALDFAFIDGMHRFEYALRDFMNIERLASPATLVAIDDIWPSHPSQAERVRRTRAWTGDIWRLHIALATVRPDLVLLGVDTYPTGMLLVAGLDRDNRVLWDNYNPIVREFREKSGPTEEVLARRGAIAPTHPGIAKVLGVLRDSRSEPAAEVRSRLRQVLAAEGIVTRRSLAL